MNYFIGVDIGTTGTKALAFDDNGMTIAEYHISYSMSHPYPEYCEQNPDDIFSAVVTCINEVQKIGLEKGGLIQGVSFSAAMHSLILIDEQGMPLTQCILWADNRAAKIADSLRKNKKGIAIYNCTGTPIHAMSPLAKLLWFKKNESANFKKAAKYIGIKEYIFYKIFGKYICDYGIASATGLMNINTLQWENLALKLTQIADSQLSILVSPNHVELFDDEKNPIIHLPKGTPFVIGSSDGCLANLGGGATDNGEVAVTIGTSGAIRTFLDKAYFDKKMRTFCYLLEENKYVIGGGTNSGAVAMQWLKEKIARNTLTYEELYECANKVLPGANTLIFLPYLLGERAPIWNAHAKGVFFGLTITDGIEQMARALMEGVIFHLYSIGKILSERQKITKIHAGGGFAKSQLWLQILADVFQAEVIVPSTVEMSAYGAAILGRKALGLVPFPNIENVHIIYPNIDNKVVYQQQFAKFEHLYLNLKGLF